KIGKERILIAPSCSLLHSPCDLDKELNQKILLPEVKEWLAFAKQKTEEIVVLKKLLSEDPDTASLSFLEKSRKSVESRKSSTLIHSQAVKQRVASLSEEDARRLNKYEVRKYEQQNTLQHPVFPTTTIGSFPQTAEVRSWRSKFRKEEINTEEYELLL